MSQERKAFRAHAKLFTYWSAFGHFIWPIINKLFMWRKTCFFDGCDWRNRLHTLLCFEELITWVCFCTGTGREHSTVSLRIALCYRLVAVANTLHYFNIVLRWYSSRLLQRHVGRSQEPLLLFPVCVKQWQMQKHKEHMRTTRGGVEHLSPVCSDPASVVAVGVSGSCSCHSLHLEIVSDTEVFTSTPVEAVLNSWAGVSLILQWWSALTRCLLWWRGMTPDSGP